MSTRSRRFGGPRTTLTLDVFLNRLEDNTTTVPTSLVDIPSLEGPQRVDPVMPGYWEGLARGWVHSRGMLGETMSNRGRAEC